MHVLTAAHRNTHTYLIYAIIALFLTLCVMLGSYAYLINKTVLNVVAREKAEDQIASLNSKVGDMEFKEMSLRNTLTLDLAHSLGFSDATTINFVNRSTPAKNLSFSR